MVITYKSIKKVSFPIFILPSENWYEKDGLLYIDNRLIDDRNMPGDTLGKRRIQTPFRNLLPLRKSLGTHIGLGAYSLEAYSLGQQILDLGKHSPILKKNIEDP